MTVSTSNNRVNANGDGVLVQFFFTFKTNDIADIRIYLDTVLQSTGYTVNLNVDQDASPGGDVTFTTAPANAVVVTIERYLIALQGIDYTPFDKFPSATHELGLDELVMMVQQLLDETGRSLKSAVDTAPGVNFTLPSPVSERFLRWNTAADNLENLDIVDLSLYAISDFAETLVDDTNADAFWATLMATINKITARSSLEAAHESANRSGNAFYTHEQSSPDMTVQLDAGHIYDVNGQAVTEVAAQSTGTISAPATDPRIDRVVVNQTTGAVSVIAGTESASPVAPALTADVFPIAQIALATNTTEISDSIITDERNSFVRTRVQLKDWGSRSADFSLDLSKAELHIVDCTAAITITITSSLANDKATVVIKNGNNVITLAGIDNDSPTLTQAASTQDFIGLIKSFGKISAVAVNLGLATV